MIRIKKSHIQMNQLACLNQTLKRAKNSKLYARKLRGCPKSLSKMAELENFPFTTKKELRSSYPFGSLAVPMQDVVEMHTSSGTTGKSTLSYFTKNDLMVSAREISKAWKSFGIDSKSRVQFMMSYGLFSGAALNTYAIQKLGGFVVPAGIQSAEKQVQMMIDFKVDTLVATQGYYFHILDYLSEANIPFEKLSLKRGIAAGEIYSEKVRKEIEKRFGIQIFDHYGLCEINTGIAYECKFKRGLHFLDNYVWPEVIDPKNGRVVSDGVEGELVLTTLKKEASPLIRYRTGDITAIRTDKCPCGSSSIRMERIKRRVDDMIFIKGIKIDPYELKEYVLEVAADRIYSDIKIRIKRDRSEILVSLKKSSTKELLKFIQSAIKDKTLITFTVKNVDRDYFQRKDNKIKLFEYVDKK
jgi:phenylacetate-CoA ligase